MRDKFGLPVDSKEEYMVALSVNQSTKHLKGILPKPGKALSCEEMNAIIKHRAL